MTRWDNAEPGLRLGRSPLVGRAAELALLEDALREAGVGRANVVLLAGEPGIGKSRLLQEFPSADLGVEVQVLRGGATEAEGMPPYLPFVEALSAYVASAELEPLRALTGPHTSILTRLVPQLEFRLGPAAPLADLPPEQERLRWFEAVVALHSRLAARSIVLLTLDDLQWADAATCDLLLHLIRRLRSERLLVLGAYRQREAEDNAPFMRARAELNRQRLVRELTVRRLDLAESGSLAAGLLGAETTSSIANLLHDHGEGNPFFAEELVRALVEAGY
ncbi:MAG: AAA family ATPase, partial [Chloroflexota bacterium]